MSHKGAQDAQEEQFVLRVQVPQLADQLRRWLREETELGGVQLMFEGCDRNGTLLVEGVAYPVALQDLPTVVESYKTLDDTNLVKSADVGQVLLVQAPGSTQPAEVQASDGVTPPMRLARRRQFRPRFTVSQRYVAQAEAHVIDILAGRAPDGWTFHDVEEEYVVDPATGDARWRPVVGKRSKAGRGSAGGDAGDDLGTGVGEEEWEPPSIERTTGGRARGRGRGRGRAHRHKADIVSSMAQQLVRAAAARANNGNGDSDG